MLSAALAFLVSDACPAADVVQRQALTAPGGRMVRRPVRENKFR